MLDKRKIKTYFRRAYKLKRSTNGWWRFNSALDSSTDMGAAVNFNYCVVKDFRNYAKAMSVYNYLKIVENGKTFQDMQEMLQGLEGTELVEVEHTSIRKRKQSVMLPEHYKPIYDDSMLGARAKAYVVSRGIDADYAFSLGLGYCDDGPFFGKIIIPYYSKGSLVYFQSRDFTTFFDKHKNPEYVKQGIWYNEDALILQSKCYIGEGFFDAITMQEQGICTGGWAIDDYQMNKLIASPCNEFTVMPDLGFYKKAMRIFARVFKCGKQVKVLNPAHYNGAKDVNEIGRDKVTEIENETKFLNNKIIYKHG